MTEEIEDPFWQTLVKRLEEQGGYVVEIHSSWITEAIGKLRKGGFGELAGQLEEILILALEHTWRKEEAKE